MKEEAKGKPKAKKNLSKPMEKKADKPDYKEIEFTFYAPEAKEVFLVGEFNNWDIHSTPMEKKNGKDWKVSLRLPPGRYEYKFFADGRWVENVPSVEKVQNQFGTLNSILYIKGPESQGID